MENESKAGRELCAQFVTFSTAGTIPPELFQQSWIPQAKGLAIRGIENIILSEKIVVPGEFNPYKFVSKNWWHSVKAAEITFPNGLPGPSTRGHITVSQGGVFKAVYWTNDELLEYHTSMHPYTKGDFKLFFMLPTQCSTPSDDEIKAMRDFLYRMPGFKSQCVFEIDPSSGDYSCAWLYSWIIEVYFDAGDTTPAAVIEEIRNSEKFSREWKICIMKDVVQIMPFDDSF